MKAVLIALACILLLGCTDESRSHSALTAQGFTDITFQGYAFFECGKGDDFATKFTAKNHNGTYVSGTVCCGLLKGCTIRY